MNNIENQKRKYHLGFHLNDFFGFVEHQKKLPMESDIDYVYYVTMTTVLNRANATIFVKIEINAIEWYVPPYTPSISQQAILSIQFLIKAPTELQYVERSIFMNEVKTQNS